MRPRSAGCPQAALFCIRDRPAVPAPFTRSVRSAAIRRPCRGECTRDHAAAHAQLLPQLRAQLDERRRYSVTMSALRRSVSNKLATRNSTSFCTPRSALARAPRRCARGEVDADAAHAVALGRRDDDAAVAAAEVEERLAAPDLCSSRASCRPPASAWARSARPARARACRPRAQATQGSSSVAASARQRSNTGTAFILISSEGRRATAGCTGGAWARPPAAARPARGRPWRAPPRRSTRRWAPTAWPCTCRGWTTACRRSSRRTRAAPRIAGDLERALERRLAPAQHGRRESP